MKQLFDSIASAFRALVMLVILGGGGYLAVKHTPILEIAHDKLVEWELIAQSAGETPTDYDWGGGSAPSYGQADGVAGTPLASPGEQPSTVPADQPPQQYAAQPAGYEAPLAPGATAPPAEVGYVALERQLRELGVSYSLLESYGAEGGNFRFFCKAALPGGSDKHQNFQAVAAEPVEALRQVVEQVRRWRQFPGSTAP
ncbi:MAG: hypothetical protein DWQ31_04770 [Planctomycetota bacterium]|nr:MAG: hypothetical protein DWQ31_04770 [Planctomycetota bacterium]REJ97095.1 MAG: hypothetical protein DWQ35_02430 [Planctomycetota bacterium]REK22479.1 MAG: hypothetical protein DWQ42_16945 [Planctomycetota bacterium]REK47121.1 MAG: hypothetical protein DWQ46_04930 [Planctomycetota bacterium]